MGFKVKIATSHLFGKEKARVLGLATLISFIAVTISVATVIVTISIMDGFDKELKRKIAGSGFHLWITGPDQKLSHPDELTEKIKGIDSITSIQPFVEGQAIFKSESKSYGGIIQGIDLPDVELVDGQMKLSDKEVLVGRELSAILGIFSQDKLIIITAPEGRPRMDEFIVSGLVTTRLYIQDATVVYLSIETAKKLLGIEGVSGLGIKAADIYKTRKIQDEIASTLGSGYWVKSWIDMNKNLFEALKTERLATGVILIMVLALASVTLFSCLTTSVIRRRREIGILRALGASGESIASIFLIEAGIVSIFGSLGGILLGLFITWVISSTLTLPGSVYYITKLPIEIDPIKILSISIFTPILCLCSSLVPSLWAANLDPIEALRYE
ncbi:FtsX-like permease family protein [bacterium]|nr:FtsX-like permease family protein [bacterium]MBU2461686.1 FtsX-like permease family protein [bacterium]